MRIFHAERAKEEREKRRGKREEKISRRARKEIEARQEEIKNE
jgi:hypothetical protein